VVSYFLSNTSQANNGLPAAISHPAAAIYCSAVAVSYPADTNNANLKPVILF